MPAVLLINKIKQQYQDEWVLIAYTQIDENLNVMEGEVLAPKFGSGTLNIGRL
jgi:alpha-mannosidase